MLFALLTATHAATVTDIPPFLRGDVEIAYSFDRLAGGLVEEQPYGCVDTEELPCTLDVGRRAIMEHQLRYTLTFSPYHGVSVGMELPHYASSTVDYTDSPSMILNAATGTGTYQGVEPTSGTTSGYSGTGLGGAWLFVKGTPFSEAFEARNNKATWLLEMGARFPDATDHWTFKEGSIKSGAGPGGAAFRLNTAFSKRFGVSEPYFQFGYQGEGVYSRRLVNVEGDPVLENDEANGGTPCPEVTDPLIPVGSCVPIKPANHVNLTMGVQLSSAENANSGGRFATDLHWGLRYDSWASTPSGSYLPGVLKVTQAQSVLQPEALELGGGMRFDIRFFKYMEWRLGADAYYHMPQRIEHQYNVYTDSDTLHLIAATDLVIRVR